MIYGKGENIQTNLKEFTEQIAFIAGVEFGDAFNCVRLGEYFTYEGEPYRNTIAHYEHQLGELDEKIADAATPTKRRRFVIGRHYLLLGMRPRLTKPSHPKAWAEWKITSLKLARVTNAEKTW